jgi:hypothetical protein
VGEPEIGLQFWPAASQSSQTTAVDNGVGVPQAGAASVNGSPSWGEPAGPFGAFTASLIVGIGMASADAVPNPTIANTIAVTKTNRFRFNALIPPRQRIVLDSNTPACPQT